MNVMASSKMLSNAPKTYNILILENINLILRYITKHHARCITRTNVHARICWYDRFGSIAPKHEYSCFGQKPTLRYFAYTPKWFC